MLQSMTAFASHSSYHNAGEVVWEIKSTNHRYLEFYFKIPEECRTLEYELREIAKKNFTRGKLDCFLSLSLPLNAQNSQINPQILEKLLNAKNLLSERFQSPVNLDLMQILNYPGIIDQSESASDKQQLFALIKHNFNLALAELKQARLKEGLQIEALIREKVALMFAQVALITQDYPNAIKNYTQELRHKFQELVHEKSSNFESRLEQELVFYLQKTQINEELERLTMHLNEVLDSCKVGLAVGRKLDFLMQELNREANTLAAKSISKVASRAAIELKVLIEQIREQVQNLE